MTTIKASEIFFDSESDDRSERTGQAFKTIRKRKTKIPEPWESCTYVYKILSPEHKAALDERFILHRMKLTKTNIREVSRELKIPYKRAISYIYDKFRSMDITLNNFSEDALRELRIIDMMVNESWNRYTAASRRFDKYNQFHNY